MPEKGFFASLFDIGFRSFVTTKIVTVLFVISLVLSAIYTLVVIAVAFDASSGVGIVVLVLSPIIYLLLVLYSRVLLEFVIVVFRIYENTAIMAGGARVGHGVPPAAPTFGQHPTPPASHPGVAVSPLAWLAVAWRPAVAWGVEVGRAASRGAPVAARRPWPCVSQ